MTSNNAAQIIIFFTASLVFTSIVVSWVLLNAYGVQVAALDFPELKETNTVDLASANSEYIDTLGGEWTINGSKRYATTENSYILFKYAQDNGEGFFTNTYTIDNSAQKDYSIILSYSNARTQKILVDNAGFHLIQNDFITDRFGSDLYTFPYEGANQLSRPTIKTVYNPVVSAVDSSLGDTPFCDFYLNGNLLFSISHDNNLIGTPMDNLFDVSYGGVGSEDNPHLGVESYNTEIKDSSLFGVDTGLNIPLQVLSYASVLLKLVVWNVDTAYLPWEINLLLIKSQVFFVGIGVFFWMRG